MKRHSFWTICSGFTEIYLVFVDTSTFK